VTAPRSPNDAVKLTALRGNAPGRPELAEIAAGVFAYVQPDGSWMINNAGAVVGGSASLMIDTTSTEPRTRLWRQALATASRGRPVRTLVNTHHHGDHTYGNWLLEPATTIVSHRACREELLRSGLAAMSLFPDADYGHVEVTPPTLTFDEQISIWVDDLEAKVIFAGPAHTLGDCVVWIPDREVLFTGDLVFNGGHPLLVEGCAANFGNALARIADLSPRIVVPGHGRAGDAGLITRMREYAAWLTSFAADAFQAGRAPLEAARRADLGPFAHWSEPERMVANLERAYSELRGEPWGTPLPMGQIVAAMTSYAGHPLTCLA
jgi:cyclase